MELVTKILSSNFFSIFTDMIKITNNWKIDAFPKEKLDFNNFIKKRLLLLSKFQFKPIKNFNLSLCLRLQFLLQNHLIACLDEKSLQVYSQYLCKENKKLIFSIIQNEKNFEVIIKELYNQNYAYLEFLIEIFYGLKNNVESFIKMQALLNNLGFMDYLNGIIAQIEIKNIDGQIFLDIKMPYFKKRENFLYFLELIMFFIYKNKNCFILKIFPINRTVTKNLLLKFLFTLPFQSTFEKSNTFVLRILEIIVNNMNELIDEPDAYRNEFAVVFCDVVEQYNLFNHQNFFLIFEMLIHNKEDDTVKNILNRIEVWQHLINNMRFNQQKAICTSLIKTASYLLNTLDYKPTNDQFATLARIWTKYLQRCKYNVLSSCIYEALQLAHNKHCKYIKMILPAKTFLVLNEFIKQPIISIKEML